MSRSSLYRRAGPTPPREISFDEDLAREIRKIHLDERYVGYGYRRTWAVLRFDRKIVVSKKKVQRIIKLKGWQAKAVPRPKRYGGEPYDRKREVVDPKQKVTVPTLDTRWATDLTRIYTDEDGWVNLIPVLDCGNSEVLGWRLSPRGRALEAREALEAAVLGRFGDVRSVPEGLSLRTDNGSIFLATEFWQELARLGIRAEYTPYRCPSANGVAERFMKTIKEECAWQHRFRNLAQAEEVIAKWIEFYNRERRHSRLKYLTPLEYRESLRKSA